MRIAYIMRFRSGKSDQGGISAHQGRGGKLMSDIGPSSICQNDQPIPGRSGWIDLPLPDAKLGNPWLCSRRFARQSHAPSLAIRPRNALAADFQTPRHGPG
jgi:hypothetical protein